MGLGPLRGSLAGVGRYMAEAYERTSRLGTDHAGAGGETACYRPLVVRYQNRLHGMVMGMVRNQEDARDIVQMAFVKAYQSLATFRIDSSFYTWIYRIAMNLAIDHCRKGKRRKTSSFEEAVGSRDEDGNLSAQHHEESPGVALARKQLHARIYAALDEVSEDMREAILLREVEGSPTRKSPTAWAFRKAR